MRRGYWFWGPVVAAILVTEAVGALSGWLEDRLDFTIAWPTISQTVGHLQELWSGAAVIVVAVIAAFAFHALLVQRTADGTAIDGERRTDQGRVIPEGDPKPQPLGFYGWWFAVVPAIIAGLVAWALTDDEYVWGYAVYGTFALFGLIIPSLLFRFAHRDVRIPSLVYTFGYLRSSRPWIAIVVVASFAILLLHLALYPWPDVTQEPKQHAGLTELEAKRKAEREINRVRPGLPELVYSTQTRGVDQGGDAWIVFFSPPKGSSTEFSGCLVVVTEARAVATPECSA